MNWGRLHPYVYLNTHLGTPTVVYYVQALLSYYQNLNLFKLMFPLNPLCTPRHHSTLARN